MKDPELARIFRALSEAIRIKLIRLLSSGEKCVCELFQALRLPQPKVSRHLAYLKRSGLVSCRKQGLWKYYSLDVSLFKRLKLDQALSLNISRLGKRKGRPRGC